MSHFLCIINLSLRMLGLPLGHVLKITASGERAYQRDQSKRYKANSEFNFEQESRADLCPRSFLRCPPIYKLQHNAGFLRTPHLVGVSVIDQRPSIPCWDHKEVHNQGTLLDQTAGLSD